MSRVCALSMIPHTELSLRGIQEDTTSPRRRHPSLSLLAPSIRQRKRGHSRHRRSSNSKIPNASAVRNLTTPLPHTLGGCIFLFRLLLQPGHYFVVANRPNAGALGCAHHIRISVVSRESDGSRKNQHQDTRAHRKETGNTIVSGKQDQWTGRRSKW